MSEVVGVEDVGQGAVSTTEMRKAWDENFYTVIRKWKSNLHKVTMGDKNSVCRLISNGPLSQ